MQIVSKLPERNSGTSLGPGRSRFTRYFAAAHRNPTKYVVVPRISLLSIFQVAKRHGVSAVQRNGRVYVFKRRAIRRARSK